MLGAWLRRWRTNPSLTGQFSATIIVGTGTLTALVSLMLALAYQPLPYRDPPQLVAIWERVESGAQVMAISGPDLQDFADATHRVFSALGGFAVPQVWLLDRKGATPVHACYIQPGVFSDLGIRPVLGRAARPDDEPLIGKATAPVWLSYRLWKSRYGGSPSIVGTTVGVAASQAGLGEVQARIAGVLPAGVSIPLPFTQNATDVWYLLPRDISPRSRESTVFFGLGRLRTGVSAAQAQAALTVVAERLAQRYSFERRKRPVVESLEAIAQGPARKTMGLLVLGVGLVFLVGCVNLAVLMGAEGRRRRREIAIRAVLGAGRWHLWCEAAAEKCTLTLFSLALGAALAFALLRVLATLLPAAGLGPPLVHPPPLNLAVLAGLAALALAAAMVWSALLVAAADGPRQSRSLAAAGGGLGYTGLSDAAPRAGRWRLILLAAQAGAGICLLGAAAFTAKTYAALSVADLGPSPRKTVLFSLNTRDNIILTDAQSLELNRQVLLRLSRLPGVQSVALADLFPPPGWPTSFVRQGDAANAAREATVPISISTTYFRTLGIRILFGRGFDATDNAAGRPTAIIGLDMAKRNWPSPAQAIGSQIAFTANLQKLYEIVGVAANFTGYWSQQPVPTVYLPEAQTATWCSEVIVRSTATPTAITAIVPQVLAGLPVPVTISDVSTMQTRWQSTLTRPLARMAGMLLLALIGLGLSLQGVYAVATGTVAAQAHELAVRSALGARPGQLAWSVTRELVFAVLVGAGLGAVAAFELQSLLQHWLGPGAVGQGGPITIAIALMVVATAAACYGPARAAARANPAESLRQG
jgi:predicted permease